MGKILIAYYSRGGNTKAMAGLVRKGAESVEGTEVDFRLVTDIDANVLTSYEGLIFGSPTYYGTMAWEMKKLFDESVSLHGKLSGKVGGAFTSSANIGGGNETTIMDILKAFLIHGMVLEGTAAGDHYGPVAIGAPDKRSAAQCEALGRRVADLVKKLAG